MRSFRRLAVVTIAATFVLIAVGGLVRATDSGWAAPTGRAASAGSSPGRAARLDRALPPADRLGGDGAGGAAGGRRLADRPGAGGPPGLGPPWCWCWPGGDRGVRGLVEAGGRVGHPAPGHRPGPGRPAHLHRLPGPLAGGPVARARTAASSAWSGRGRPPLPPDAGRLDRHRLPRRAGLPPRRAPARPRPRRGPHPARPPDPGRGGRGPGGGHLAGGPAHPAGPPDGDPAGRLRRRPGGRPDRPGRGQRRQPPVRPDRRPPPGRRRPALGDDGGPGAARRPVRGHCRPGRARARARPAPASRSGPTSC